MGLIQGCKNPHRFHGFLLSAAPAFILLVGLNPPATHDLLAEEANSGSGGPSGAPSVKFFAERVRPVLLAHCLMCHNKELKQAGLDVTTRESLLKGGDDGPVVVPGNAAASLLYKKVRHEHEPGMPYKMARLPEEVVAQIGEWINSGAPYDGPLRAGERCN